MRILTDVDDVLAEFTPPWLELIADVVGKKYQPEDFTTWQIDSIFDEDTQKAIWKRVDESPGFIRNLPPLPGAENAIKELRKLGTVAALTSPHIGPHWFYERALWLMDRGFKRKNMCFFATKEWIPADVLIDDNPDHISKWKTDHPHGLAFLWDRPNTRGYSTPGIRTSSWDEILDKVHAFKQANQHRHKG
jgi:5'-nucleotidase